MKLLFKDTIIVIALFIALLLPLEVFVFPYTSNNIYNYKYNYVQDNSDKISILLMGNSYFENSINPHLLGDSIFDMAVGARWIHYDDELMKRFIPNMKNLKVIVFPMGYKMPFLDSHHYKDNKIIDYVHEKYMHVWYDRFPDKYFRYLYIIEGITSGLKLFDDNVYCDSLGYTRVLGHQNDNWQNEHNITRDTIFSMYPESQIKEYIGYLDEMAMICAQNNIRFIVLTPPCHNSFNVNICQEGIDILHGIIERVRLRYPIEYIDYLQDEEFRADSIYYNCSHLNTIGADLFALRVKKDFGL